jgi:oligopeptide/dipeptide ABC transporter ATP-binding protein
LSSPLLEVTGLRKTYRLARRPVHAVDGVDLHVDAGETLGLVGESGSGKTTLARLIPRLIEPTLGTIRFDGVDVTAMTRRELPPFRRHVQVVFQDPYASLDSLATVCDSVGEPLRTHLGLRRAQRRARVDELFVLTGLSGDHLDRYPGELSGGQLQRVAIARALAADPKLIILDEPVSSLDVSTRAQIINLLCRLQAELALAYLFIGHDLAIVRHVSDRIAVMYLGEIVEEGPADRVYEAPKHPYTFALVSAVPIADPVRQRARARLVLDGDLPSAINPPAGCRFHPRCPYVMEICREEPPEAYLAPDGTRVRCHLHSSGPKLSGESVTTIGQSQSTT